MEFMDRLVTTLLDGKFASYEAKKELTEALGLKTEDILGFELLSDEMDIHQAIVVTFKPCIVLDKSKLDDVPFDYLTTNTNGSFVMVLYDEPK